ncbi:uncharacterized protein LOC116765851 isoform X2 [Danaus plexippus]|uniref:uncharacterized protein LOC116765851 isoform X2 n=1 Tax=Danaus plexippus TaxID=13037 RepID=UPI0013C51B1D|nr:uncharacterized protein LOC116765851 isoform X2 [Danaus plexippus]
MDFEVHESKDDHIILTHQGHIAGQLWDEMDRNSSEVPREFLETGRTGRRNAMPDILHPQGAEVTTADLPSRLQQLVTTDPDNPQPGTSKSDLDPASADVTEKKDSCS